MNALANRYNARWILLKKIWMRNRISNNWPRKQPYPLFYYQRLFTKLVKKPVMEYIKLRRLAKACEILKGE